MKGLEMGDCPVLSGWTQCHHKYPCGKGVGKRVRATERDVATEAEVRERERDLKMFFYWF